MPSRAKYSEAETQGQRQEVLAVMESGGTIQQAAKKAGVPLGRARWLHREGLRLQHSTTQESVSTYPLPEV